MSKEIEKTTVQAEQPAEIMEDVKPYTFRKLETADIFPMFKLLNKIGFKDLKDNEGLKKTLFMFMGGTTGGKVDVNVLGMDIFFEIAAVICEAIPKAEAEIYGLLASVASVKVEDIKKQSPAVTLEMIVDFCKKEEFKDFFSVVLKLFK
jgi:hypothetical protein